LEVTDGSNSYVYLLGLISMAHSFPRLNLTNFADNMVNSAAHSGYTGEILRLDFKIMNRQVKFML